jgi:hypothetical protein
VSNDVISLIQNSLSTIEGGLDEDTRAVAGNGAASKRISIKGGVFRKMVGGKEIGAIDDRHMNVIIVKMAHDPSRTYYSGAYKEGEKTSPVCWSNDSRTPDPEVKNPPAASCSSCPYSVKGSGQSGMGTACRLSWRTAVVLPADPSGDVMQLVLPATSCFGKEDAGRWPFRPYVQMLANHNISAGRVVTKMQFDTKSPVPRLLFSPVGAVEAASQTIVQQQGKTPAAENAIKLTVFQSDGGVEEVAASEVAAFTVEGVTAEPQLRENKKTEAPTDVSETIKKWSKK